MLWEKLIGANAGSSVKLVGYAGSASTNNSGVTSTSISLNSLTGGIGTAAQAGDLVILACAVGDISQNTPAASGYTSIANVYANNTTAVFSDTSLGVRRKLLTAADTSVTVSWTAATFRWAAVAYVLRNVNSTTPLDATATTSLSTTIGQPDAPSITTVTSNALVLAIGAANGATPPYLASLTAPSGMANLVSRLGYNGSTAIAIASVKQSAAGAYNPNVFGGGSASGTSAAAVTLAIRPA